MTDEGLVVDASIVIRALAEDPGDELLRHRLATSGRLHAPAHLAAEVLSGIRGLTLGGHLTQIRAEQAIDDFLDLPIVRHPIEAIAAQVWLLRHNFTAYDGAYVALAGALNLALLTCDQKIGQAAPAGVEVHAYS